MTKLALILGTLSAICLTVIFVAFTLRMGWTVMEALASLIRHEMLMRPKERYYRM